MRSIKEILDKQQLAIGLGAVHACGSWLPKLYYNAGADFLYIDCEHIFFNGAELAELIMSARSHGLPVVAKCEYLSRGSITKLLDAGVTAIQLPMSETAEQLAEVVSYVKFPPQGIRAAKPGIGNCDYEPVDVTAWLKQTNKETTVIAHIESLVGLGNVDEILSVPGVDIMFIGTFDLSISLGHPADYNHPEIASAIERLLDSAKRHSKIAGMWAPCFEVAGQWIEKGVRFFEGMGEIAFISNGSADFIKNFPDHRPRISKGDSHT